jgi:hypothetical protein
MQTRQAANRQRICNADESYANNERVAGGCQSLRECPDETQRYQDREATMLYMLAFISFRVVGLKHIRGLQEILRELESAAQVVKESGE